MFSQAHQLLQWTAYFRQGLANTAPEFESVVGSLRFAGPTVIEAGGQEVCDSLAAALATYWASTGANIPSNCFLTTVKWNKIAPNGKYDSDGNTVLTDMAGTGGGREAKYPTQVAWATTWDTAKTRGRAARGRTFWPTTAGISPLYTTVNASEAQSKANADLRLIGTLNSIVQAAVPGENYAAVMSNIGAGATNRITGTRVGIRLDIQRRRGKGVTESYVTGTTS